MDASANQVTDSTKMFISVTSSSVMLHAVHEINMRGRRLKRAMRYGPQAEHTRLTQPKPTLTSLASLAGSPMRSSVDTE